MKRFDREDSTFVAGTIEEWQQILAAHPRDEPFSIVDAAMDLAPKLAAGNPEQDPREMELTPELDSSTLSFEN
jgi:hypothetical protein